MLIVITWIIFLAILGSLAFFRTSLKISTVVIGLSLLILSIFQLWSWWILIPLWLIFVATAIILNVPMIRRHFLSKFLLKEYRAILPPMSVTERIALEAGDVWWEGELFRGRPDWKKLLTMPKPQLTDEELAFINNQVETLCGMLNDWEIVFEHFDMPEKIWNYLKQERFLGLVIGKKYGGHGFSAQAHSAIVTKIASRSASAAVSIMVPNSLGPAELIERYGTDAQKKYYLPRLAKAEEIPCFALTGPEAGSDAGAIPDTGIVCRGEYQGQNIIGIRLNWNKRYITLAPIATLLGIAFKLYDPEHLLGEQDSIGITLGLIPTNHPGVTIGNRHVPLRLAFMNGPTHGKDVFIPLDWIIGGPEMRGKGWQMMMESLSVGRGISLPSLATGAAKICYRMAGAYARIRRQFKTSIGRLEGVQEALARIGGFTYICEATRIMSANAVDQHIKPALASAITKYHLTELGRRIVNDAMDIYAGKGIQMGPHNFLALFYDAIPTSITVEGANILTRNLIIFGQGAIRCHPYVLRELEAAADTNVKTSLAKFDKLIFAHMGYMLSNLTKSFIYGITGARFIAAPVAGPLATYYRQLTCMSTALALVSDAAMGILGGGLKRRERLSARLGDVLSYLYLASSVLRYYDNQNNPPSDLPFVSWSLEWCLAHIKIAFDGFFRNFPQRWIGGLLRFIIFPSGKSYKMPADKLGQKIADEMMSISVLRDRITQFCYVGKDANDVTGSIETAFQAMIMAEPIRIKLKNAIRNGQIPRAVSFAEQAEATLKSGLLTAEEIQLLQTAQTLQAAAIQVDDFPPATFVRKRNNGRNKNQSE